MASNAGTAAEQEQQHEHEQLTPEERNAEIWSTRIQQELLALTTDDADMESLTEARSTLPNFTKITKHELDLAKGTCILTVQVDIVVPQQQKKKNDEEQQTDTAAETNDEDDNTKPAEEQEEQQQAEDQQDGQGEAEETTTETTTTGTTTKSVTVSIEASLQKSNNKKHHHEPSYPFIPPIAKLQSGKELFPTGSTIDNGDIIGMDDLDWTPSLHLTDSIMNIGLKIKETILQNEPFHPLPSNDNIANEVDEVVKGARRFASKLGQTASSFGKKAFSSPKGHGHGGDEKKKTPKHRNSNKKKGSSPKSPVTPGDVKIGDEINFLEKPWEDAHGVYTCKAIRRPPFVEEIIQKSKKHNKKGSDGDEQQQQHQMSSPSAMFRSFAQSARSVIEESFLMITDTHIIELRASKLNMQIGHVTFCIPIEQMAKLKFRREESLSLFFKASPDDPLIYMCPDSGDAVHQIQTVLKGKGVRGKHTNAAAYRAINEALQMVGQIQTKELALDHEPTVERVNEIMDLYRQAAERFEIAGDIRHEEVVTHMRKFLAKPITNQILDGSHKKKEEEPSPTIVAVPPVGEVLEKAHAEASDEFDEHHHADETTAAAASSSPAAVSSKEEEKAKDKEFEENIDSLMKDAKEDFEKFDLGDNDSDNDFQDAAASAGDDGLEGMAADLDAMMKEADKELAELMGS